MIAVCSRRNIKLHLHGRLRHVLFLAVLALTSACSHTTPYYHPQVPAVAPDPPQAADIAHRLLLIGDAGQPASGHAEPVLVILRQQALRMPDRTTVVFLGDNIYPSGLPPLDAPERKEAERRLLAQIKAVRTTRTRGIFIPGNHDWHHSKPQGLAAVRRQQAFIDSLLGDGSFLPKNGCPGPVAVDAPQFRLIIIDSQWWLHKHEKPIATCFPDGHIGSEADAKAQFLSRLGELVATAGERHVVVAAHHPVVTHGPHGGFFSWKDHIFPLTRLKKWFWIPTPIIGSLYPLWRWYVTKSDQDIVGPRYRELIARLREIFAATGHPVIFTAGHDHGLQVLKGDGPYAAVLVSGAGSEEKQSEVGHGDDTLFAHVQPGFIALEFLHDGRIFLRVLEQAERGEGAVEMFSYWLVK